MRAKIIKRKKKTKENHKIAYWVRSREKQMVRTGIKSGFGDCKRRRQRDAEKREREKEIRGGEEKIQWGG